MINGSDLSILTSATMPTALYAVMSTRQLHATNRCTECRVVDLLGTEHVHAMKTAGDGSLHTDLALAQLRISGNVARLGT
jgi:hypothetical protein